MGRYVGLDWAGKGWFGAAVVDSRWTFDLFPTVWSAWRAHGDADRVLIDIPIGLPGRAGPRRACDEEAKRVLGSHHSSVFYTPVRPAVYATNIEAAKEINAEAGYSIQNQAWSIVPRIREMDEFLDMHPGARDRFRETHPEVCYQAMADRSLTHAPTTADGIAERRDILLAVEPNLTDPLDNAVTRFTAPRYAPLVTDASHIQDAIVAALTARRAAAGLESLPRAPPTDARGLAMEIVFPTDTQQLTLEEA